MTLRNTNQITTNENKIGDLVKSLIDKYVGPYQVKPVIYDALVAKAKVLMMERKDSPLVKGDEYAMAIKAWANAHTKLVPLAMKSYDLIVTKLETALGKKVDPNADQKELIMTKEINSALQQLVDIASVLIKDAAAKPIKRNKINIKAVFSNMRIVSDKIRKLDPQPEVRFTTDDGDGVILVSWRRPAITIKVVAGPHENGFSVDVTVRAPAAGNYRVHKSLGRIRVNNLTALDKVLPYVTKMYKTLAAKAGRK